MSHTDAPLQAENTQRDLPPRLNDMSERRISSVILEWLNEVEVEDAKNLARKIAANLRPTIDADLGLRYPTGAHHVPGCIVDHDDVGGCSLYAGDRP